MDHYTVKMCGFKVCDYCVSFWPDIYYVPCYYNYCVCLVIVLVYSI